MNNCERAASSPEGPEGPFWRYSPASKARGVSGLGNGRHPAITDEREERERVSRYRVRCSGRAAYMGMRDRILASLGGPSGVGWNNILGSSGGGLANRWTTRKRTSSGEARPGEGGRARSGPTRGRSPTGRATAPRSHRAPGQSCLHECTSHGATACIVHVPIDGDIRYGYVVSYDATANSSGQRRATPTPTNRPHAHGWTGAARRKTGP